MAGRNDPGPVPADLFALLEREGVATAFYGDAVPGGRVRRSDLAAEVRAFAGHLSPARHHPDGGGSVWVAVRDPYRQVVAALGALMSGPAALVERDGPPALFETLALACPPDLIVCDIGNCGAARWAAGRGLPVQLVPAPGTRRPAAGPDGPAADAGLQFFTSGTTGPVKCVTIGLSTLLAAVTGVGRRLGLSGSDVSLSIAPLTHTLGFVTSVLAGLAAGGSVAFADPQRPAAVLET